MSSRRSVLIVLILLCSTARVWCAETTPFKSLTRIPQQLESGSVCLFTLTLSAPASSVTGKWMGHDLVFAKGKGRNVWFAAAGVDVEAKPGNYPISLEASLPDGKSQTLVREVRVQPAQYKTVKLSVPSRYVEPDAATLEIIKADKAIKDKAFARPPQGPEWSGDFDAPVNSTVSEPFGTRRTFNGKLASVHRGVDYHAAPGTPVRASNSGEVILARQLFYEGNCVVLDHGQGLMTIYMHLSKLEVAEGDKVSRREVIGLSGATGRVTGPHLHMAARWQGAYVDPLKLLKLPMPEVHESQGTP